MKLIQFIINLIFLPLFIIGAVLLVKNWIANIPEREIKKTKIVLPRVAFIETTKTTFTPTIQTFGNTRSYYETQVSAQVTGEISNVSSIFDTGQAVSKGDLLLEIDPADFLNAIAQAESTLAQAAQTLAEEKTRSQIAADDWTASGRELAQASEFTLRKPQLNAAQANLKSAESELQQARLNLERTRIRAPFHAIITERTASPGNIVSAGASLGSLISSEKAEIRIPLTPEQVQLAILPSKEENESGQPLLATVTSPSQPDISWQARLVRTEPSVDPQNQVLFFIAEVDQPFTNSQFLPLAAFVNVQLAGKPIPDCYILPSTALVEDRFVWLIDEHDTLQQLKARRLFVDQEQVLLAFEDPPAIPLRIATRPLSSFQAEQEVAPLTKKPTAQDR